MLTDHWLNVMHAFVIEKTKIYPVYYIYIYRILIKPTRVVVWGILRSVQWSIIHIGIQNQIKQEYKTISTRRNNRGIEIKWNLFYYDFFAAVHVYFCSVWWCHLHLLPSRTSAFVGSFDDSPRPRRERWYAEKMRKCITSHCLSKQTRTHYCAWGILESFRVNGHDGKMTHLQRALYIGNGCSLPRFCCCFLSYISCSSLFGCHRLQICL